MTNSDRTPAAAIADLDARRAERPHIAERMPAVANAATATNIVYADGCLAYAYGHGIGSLTLYALRQLVDTSGQLYEDQVIVGLLRAPMQALRHLRACIDEIEKLEAQHAAAAVAAMERPAGLAH